MFIPHQRVNIDICKGYILHKMDTHHHHPGHPEKEDIKARYEDRCGIKCFQEGRLFRPSHGGEGPESRTEPGIQNVGFPDQVLAVTSRAGFRSLHGNHDLLALLTGPRRNLVTPPDLPGNAPVFDVVHPLVIGFLPCAGDNPGLSGVHGFDGFFSQGFCLDKPLPGQVRFDDCLTAVAMSDTVRMGFYFLYQPFRLECFYHGVPAFEPVHALEPTGFSRHNTVVTDNFDTGQVVFYTDGQSHWDREPVLF